MPDLFVHNQDRDSLSRDQDFIFSEVLWDQCLCPEGHITGFIDLMTAYLICVSVNK